MSVVAERNASASKPEIQPKQAVYFPGLNPLRFFAATGVVVHHLEQIKSSFGFPNCADLWIATAVGKESVRLFFVLSGFLITYLLLMEKDSIGSIDVKSFYRRRILRIWPLYFAIVLLSFVAMPLFLDCTGLLPHAVSDGMHKLYQDYFAKLALYCSFLPNLTVYMYEPVYGGGHLWSIAAEEQFYLMWPLLLICFQKAPLVGFLAILATKFAVLLGLQHAAQSKILYAISGSIQSNGVESFVAGGVMAWLFLKKRTLAERIVKNPTVICLGVVGIITCLMVEVPCYVLIMNICFAWLVAYQCTKASGTSVVDRFLRYMGTISYGIYMFHPVVIFCTLTFAQLLPPLPAPVINLVLYSSVLIVTILISSGSYECFEKVFLKQKERLAKVQSRSC